MTDTLPLTVYYDASCPLCRAEMHALKQRDTDGLLTLTDCSTPDFDASPLQPQVLNRAALMAALHVRDAQGRWHIGVDAFNAVYRTAGLPGIGMLWAHPFTRPLTTRLYPWIARHRQLLSRLGLHKPYEWLMQCHSRRAQHRYEGRTCKAGGPPCNAVADRDSTSA
jgi:predicted DCC family thiol-disulfide oxidoreductase YuxK